MPLRENARSRRRAQTMVGGVLRLVENKWAHFERWFYRGTVAVGALNARIAQSLGGNRGGVSIGYGSFHHWWRPNGRIVRSGLLRWPEWREFLQEHPRT